jgi:hypothetical protein
MTEEIALIHTSKGNLPVASLEYKTQWNDQPEYITFSEYYLLGEEIVKSSLHVYQKHGVQLNLTQTNI